MHFCGITNIYWGCQTGNLYTMLQQSVQHTQTPYTSNLNWQNTAVVSIHGASSKTTDLWKRKKKAPKFTLIYVSLQMMQKTAFLCVCLFFFSGTNQPGEKMIYKTFKDTFAASVITQTQNMYIHTVCRVFIGARQWSSATCTERSTHTLAHFVWRVHGY